MLILLPQAFCFGKSFIEQIDDNDDDEEHPN